MGLSVVTYALAKKYADKVGAAGSAALEQAIADAIAESKLYTDDKLKDINTFDVAIVDTLPTSDIDPHTIYFVPKNILEPSNSYYEYIYANNKWELIGHTDVDFTQYYTKEEVQQYVAEHAYDLPMATETTLGGIKIDGESFNIEADGTLSVSEEMLEDVIHEKVTSIPEDAISNLF